MDIDTTPPSPFVSVIVPVYNAETHLRKCLDSIICQSLKNIEIICVDDGSTDSSPSILNEYAAKDTRIKIIQQKNQFAGAARNAGMKLASGIYLTFLDSDDFFEPTLLEETFRQSQTDSADVCIYDADYYHTETDEFSPFHSCFCRHLLPANTPFSRQNTPNDLFQICAALPWNKLYKRSMLQENEIYFPNLKRSEDSSFACMALACSKKITSIRKILCHYRQDHGNNQQSGADKTPLDWYKAQMILKEELIRIGIFEELRCTYLKFMIGNGYYYLTLMKSFDGFSQAFYALRNGLIEHEPDLKHYKSDLGDWFVEIANKILSSPTDGAYLFDSLKETERQLANSNKTRKKSKKFRKAIKKITTQYHQILELLTRGK